MEYIRNRISKHTLLTHTIHFDIKLPIDSSTYAASILLRQYYRDMDITFTYGRDWRYLFIAKRTWLRHIKKDGCWTCHYCGKKLYKMPKRNKNRQSIKGCVTLDHKKAASKCDDITDSTNFLECCSKCNKDKKDMSYEKFIKRFKKQKI